MLTDGRFWFGVIVGAGLYWAAKRYGSRGSAQ